MRALCVKQPYAWLIVTGQKTVEIRSWQTAYRGPILICASANPRNIVWGDGDDPDDPDEGYTLPSGCHLGVVNLIDVRGMLQSDEDDSWCDYDPDAFAWVLSKPRHCEPRKIVGKLQLFTVPDDLFRILPKGKRAIDFAS